MLLGNPTDHLLNTVGPLPAYGKKNKRISALELGCGQMNQSFDLDGA